MAKRKPGSVDAMLDEIRAAMARCTAPERAVYEAVCSEAEGWEMRLQELEEGADDE